MGIRPYSGGEETPSCGLAAVSGCGIGPIDIHVCTSNEHSTVPLLSQFVFVCIYYLHRWVESQPGFWMHMTSFFPHVPHTTSEHVQWSIRGREERCGVLIQRCTESQTYLRPHNAL